MDGIRQFVSTILRLIFPETNTALRVRETTPEMLGRLLSPKNYQNSVVLLPYRHASVRSLIIETKFHRNQKAVALLGLILKDYLLISEQLHEL